MGLFSRREKRKPQTVDIENEINRIAKYMWEYEGRMESIDIGKVFITERDYNLICNGITKVIVEVIEQQSAGLPKDQIFQAITKGQNLVNRIIDKIYDVDWIY